MINTMCDGTGTPVRFIEATLPNGVHVCFGCCSSCGYVPEAMVMGHRKVVRGIWIMLGHDVVCSD